MSKIYTLNDLQDKIDGELSWRKLELSNFKSKIPLQKNISQQSFIRAGVVLLYAHWEGYMKLVSEHYLQFVSSQKKYIKDLKACFVYYSIDKLITKYGVKANELNFMRIDKLIEDMNSRAHFSHKNKIKTKSNLTFDVLENMLLNIGIDRNPFYLKTKKINELVNIRNSIAHGEYHFPDYNYFIDIYRIILQIMEEFKDEIIDSAINNKYLRI